MVKVYATAVLPLFSVCHPSTYRELKNDLIDHDPYEIQKEYIYSKITSMYSCLGLTCDMVGVMLEDDVLRCDDSSDLKSLAGYIYASDEQIVSRASEIDVHIQKVEVFIENGMSFSDSQELLFATAFDLYKNGQHSSDIKGGTSLSSIARDTNRDIVPVFQAYTRYFNFDEEYADTLIVNAFQRKGIFQQATVDQRKRVISFSLKYMVTFMAILEKLYSTVKSCKEDNRVEGAASLDIAAGYFVGSMEGKDEGGSFDGGLIFMLAKRMCGEHCLTCTTTNCLLGLARSFSSLLFFRSSLWYMHSIL
jgi:hypothetical protein